MISVKYAIIMAVGAFAAGSFFASPLPEAIASTIANDVICSGCVGTSDLAGNAVTAAKIKDSEVKAAEIASDSVGGSELIGVTKLLFGQCVLTSTEASQSVSGGGQYGFFVECTISGVDSDDSAIATLNGGSNCFEVTQALTQSGHVNVLLKNNCSTTQSVGSLGNIGIMVFDR